MPVLPPTIAVVLSLGLAAPEAYPGAAELAAEAPLPEWKPEGGTAAHKGEGDIHEVNKKIKRAAHTTIAGGAIAVLGLSSLIGGFVVYSLPRNKLKKLESDNGGALPPGDESRQRAITMARVSPIVMGVGAGVLVIGAVMAGVGAKRFKKLREEKRTTVAFAPMPARRGGGFMLEVRF
ncbi:MAG TPA: hypothetical protein VG755_41800 [Nannocystaceae bacterium]|nr:hypothetical protein [Nannocystaceae bacterium]